MEKNSETVAEIVREMNFIHEGMIAFEFQCYAARVAEAHRREVAELRRQREEALTIVNDVEKCASIERHTESMLKKNGVIAGLRKEVAELRECLNEAVEDACESCDDEDDNGCSLCRKECRVNKWRKTLEGGAE